ncbi:BC1881 family protein [Alkaliphilus metalliredigens]|uniref:BC1881 family protein n=1 Tax=Alkaliphilus metalliredigens TaxID=208226 RepID=UPI00031E69AD|nr:BC1881 family protein [Alkaliphilus metalliredigens]
MIEKRKVGKGGSIRYKNKNYTSNVLKKYVGRTFEIEPLLEVNVLWVFDDEKSRICEARQEGVSFEETFGIAKKEEVKGDDDVFFGLGKKLKDYKEKELAKELANRHGAKMIKVSPGQFYQVKGNGSRIKEEGPATIFVIRNN